jgi:hypothetical protein
MRKTFTQIMTEYGPIALFVYLVIFATVLLAAWTAIGLGWKPDSAAGNVGAFTAAYLTTKVTQPLRIAATLAATPVVARVYERFAGPRAPRSE